MKVIVITPPGPSTRTGNAVAALRWARILRRLSHRVTTAAYLKNAAASKKVELVVVDPPRAGLGTEVARNLAALAPARLTYVSCDPATLARDLTVFLQSGYALDHVHLVDLFPQTYHIETVVQLTRKSAA